MFILHGAGKHDFFQARGLKRQNIVAKLISVPGNAAGGNPHRLLQIVDVGVVEKQIPLASQHAGRQQQPAL